MANSDPADRSLPPWTLPAIIAAAIAALIAFLLAYCGGEPAETATTTAAVPTISPADGSPATASPGTAAKPPPDVTEEFRDLVMFDREREPPWLDRVTRVRWADNGQLHAETTYPADWSDADDRFRPVESICGQLTAYMIRKVGRWTGVAVIAEDGTELVVRTSQRGSCRQDT
jgi:hypothetical protein